ncbi:hypothetical protein [Streptomyces silvensis]|uniref:Conjugal transfer protein TrbL n=1 Tax=Streptomyces silvensis TaxID=1765722 RepID=A0A0W7XAZ5_9ACTN|nr:hypothetical protein [Streptomyces silvensis]KUF20142.1 hypothetical protein AT728_40165 [Streptomyces silvensis]
MPRPLVRMAALLGALLIVMSSTASIAVAAPKPPDPYPQELLDRDTIIGVDKRTGEYCDTQDPDLEKRETCRVARDCEEMPAGSLCAGEGSHDPKESRRYELNALKRWQKKEANAANFEKLNAFMEKCVKTQKKPFQECLRQGEGEYPPPAKGPLKWVAGKISEMASDALRELAAQLGAAVVWLLKQFVRAYNLLADIQLAKTGIGPVLGITTALSAVLAAFLLLIQFGKVAVSQQGGPLATALSGLAKWGVVLGFYLVATQTALDWSHTLSEALMDASFKGGGEGMQERIGTIFAALTGGGGAAAAGAGAVVGSGAAPAAVGFVIVISIVCVLAIVALWIELLVRQAAIMALMVAMPLILAGQMADATRDWLSKARTALIALVLMDPTISLVFSIGFSLMAEGEGVQNIIVGLVMFTTAGVSWPVLARYLIINGGGSGSSAMSGMVSSLGNSMSSLFGGNQASLAGAGTVGGGSGYTRTLERENSSTADGDSSAASSSGSPGGGFWSKAMMGRGGSSFMSKSMGAAGMGLQLAAVGKDMAESAFQNTAAHAGLDNGNAGGRHSVIAPRGARESVPEQATAADPAPDSSPAPAASGTGESAPGSQETQPPSTPAPTPQPAGPEGSPDVPQ